MNAGFVLWEATVQQKWHAKLVRLVLQQACQLLALSVRLATMARNTTRPAQLELMVNLTNLMQLPEPLAPVKYALLVIPVRPRE